MPDTAAEAISRDHSPAKNDAEALRLAWLCLVAIMWVITWPYRELFKCYVEDGEKSKASKASKMALTCFIMSFVESFLLLGSDGIFDATKEQFALTHARKALRTSQKLQDVAVALWQSAGKISAQISRRGIR